MKSSGIEAVHTDIDLIQSSPLPVSQMLTELIAVTGHSNRFNTFSVFDGFNNVYHVTAYRRFTAGNPDFFGANLGKAAAYGSNLADTALVLWGLALIAIGQAILTAKSANMRTRK